MADVETRHWRSLAHRALDPLWQGGRESRSAVYRGRPASWACPSPKPTSACWILRAAES
ncbi:TPA: hypothetical protein RNT04_001484 [Stenotrophomonas maltophilia]|nr:hypothetical protein [Stenotrophomonas maltophilia]HDX0808018.1 hypothetical protein [Stenotrophomonas maltophilia]HDX0818642.1 hypothetical protein [Stenotrophomonas maltophilia]HDX0832337.1 hypothetical protein [Stenotrophomonas maltophilia]HDX0855980.1 hypothetical protein [Stenotrophomonas maltophilia]